MDFNLIFIIVSIFIFGTFILVIFMMFSSKFRGKLLSKQIESMKYMTDYSEEDMEKILTKINQVGINSKKNILDDNEDTLKEIADKNADINKDAIKEYAKSFKDGLKDTVYCKYCGEVIDSDSIFCTKCGKEQYTDLFNKSFF